MLLIMPDHRTLTDEDTFLQAFFDFPLYIFHLEAAEASLRIKRLEERLAQASCCPSQCGGAPFQGWTSASQKPSHSDVVLGHIMFQEETCVAQ